MNLINDMKKNLDESRYTIPHHTNLLKGYFKKTFRDYKNIEKLQDTPQGSPSACDSFVKLFTNGVNRDFGSEWKLSKLGTKRRDHKEKGLYSAENISTKETGSMSSSLRNTKGVDLLILFEFGGVEVTKNCKLSDFSIIGVYYWKKFADWFDQNWQDYEENETKSSRDGKIWHTDNRLIPLSILEIFKVGDY